MRFCENHSDPIQTYSEPDILACFGGMSLQSSESSSKQKNEVISRLEEKMNQMAGTIKQLDSRSGHASL